MESRTKNETQSENDSESDDLRNDSEDDSEKSINESDSENDEKGGTVHASTSDDSLFRDSHDSLSLSQSSSHSRDLGTSSITLRDAMESFYQEFNPDKIGTIDTILEKYVGHEEKLFEELKLKYNVTVFESFDKVLASTRKTAVRQQKEYNGKQQSLATGSKSNSSGSLHDVSSDLVQSLFNGWTGSTVHDSAKHVNNMSYQSTVPNSSYESSIARRSSGVAQMHVTGILYIICVPYIL